MIYSYKEIRKVSPLDVSSFKRQIAEIICMLISPIFSKQFLKLNISPNTITLFMIISGVIGGILFILPSLICKILGIVFFFLWFVFDCSDGEVARITRNFSKYGKEMDFIAHLICHPLLMIGVGLSYYQMNRYDINVISLLSIIFISAELIGRSLILFETYLFPKSNGIITTPRIGLIKYILIQPLYFPNFVLFFPILIVLDFTNIINSYYIFIFWSVYYIFYLIVRIYRFVILFYKS